VKRPIIGAVALSCVALLNVALSAQQTVPVRHPEGLVHGFLVLSSLQGQRLADGDLIQHAQGDRVTTRLTFRFKDGSRHDETAVYTQRQHFRLLTYKLEQTGPTFPQPLDMSIDTASGRVTTHYRDDGQEQVDAETIELPADIANGLISTILKNVSTTAPPESISFVAATPKPRLVRLMIRVAGAETFSTGGTARKATHFVLKPKIGGFAGVVAPVLGKTPPDVHVWILGGDTPAFVRAEQPLYAGGPIWRIELTSPTWR
jgi:hypothetical protein